MLVLFLCPALLPVHGLGLGDAAGIALLFGHAGLVDGVQHVIDGRCIVFIQTQPGRCARAKDLVNAGHHETRLCTHMVAQTHAAAVEAFLFGPARLLHPLVGILEAVHVVGVQHGKVEFLSTNNHFLAPFVGPCPGAAPERTVFTA